MAEGGPALEGLVQMARAVWRRGEEEWRADERHLALYPPAFRAAVRVLLLENARQLLPGPLERCPLRHLSRDSLLLIVAAAASPPDWVTAP